MRLCVLARASAFYEEGMRRLLVCACVSLFTVSGIAGARAAVETSDQVPIRRSRSAGASQRGTRRAACDRKACRSALKSRNLRHAHRVAESNELPVPFFIRLLFQESGFKPDVVSGAGAQGIAQFMPETAATVGLDNPFDPMQAIAASARLLRNLVRQFGNLGLAAAAYNAGPRRISELARAEGQTAPTKHNTT